MKKLCLVLVAFLLLGLSGNVAYATSGTPGEYSIDPEASYPLAPATANIYYNTNDYVGQDLCQKFTPSKNVIADYLYANVGAVSSSGTQMKIRANVGGVPGAGYLAVYNPPAAFENPGHTYMSRFTADGYTQVTAGEYYWLCISAPAGTEVWWYAAQPGLYDNGFLQHGIGGSEANQDFGFQIWSSNMQEAVVKEDPEEDPDTNPAPTSTPAAGAPLPEGVVVGSGAAPATPTSSIKAPSELVAADVPSDQGGAIKLDWKASTSTDIAGYKIFRSTEEKKNFAEIARTTEKSIITYTDTTAAIGQKYYYMVRAYKDTKESASSNTANAASADNTAPATPKNFTFSKQALDFYFAWDKNTESDLLGYALLVLDSEGKIIKTIEIAKELNEYELIVGDHQELEVGKEYKFALIAKDANSNSSEQAMATEKNQVVAEEKTEDNKGYTLWYVIGGVLLILIGGGALYWFKFRKKKLKGNIV